MFKNRATRVTVLTPELTTNPPLLIAQIRSSKISSSGSTVELQLFTKRQGDTQLHNSSHHQCRGYRSDTNKTPVPHEPSIHTMLAVSIIFSPTNRPSASDRNPPSSRQIHDIISTTAAAAAAAAATTATTAAPRLDLLLAKLRLFLSRAVGCTSGRRRSRGQPLGIGKVNHDRRRHPPFDLLFDSNISDTLHLVILPTPTRPFPCRRHRHRWNWRDCPVPRRRLPVSRLGRRRRHKRAHPVHLDS